MGFVGVRHLERAQVVERVLVGLVALVAARDVEDLHATGLGILKKLQRPRGQGRAIGGDPAVPHRIIEKLLVLADQKAPVGVAAEDGVVDIADDRRFLVAGFLVGQGLVQTRLGDVETLVVQRAEFRRGLAPCHRIDQQVGAHGGFGVGGLRMDQGRGQQQQGQGDRVLELRHSGRSL
ncbi:hypothetical protein D3C80_1200860 [compost metagenome]